MVYFRSVGWPHYSQNSDTNVRSAKSSLPVQNNSPNFTRLGKQLTQGVCCASLTCVSKTIGRREIFFGRTPTRSKIGRCAVSGSRWRSREGFCCAALLLLTRGAEAGGFGRAVVTRLGQLGERSRDKSLGEVVRQKTNTQLEEFNEKRE